MRMLLKGTTLAALAVLALASTGGIAFSQAQTNNPSGPQQDTTGVTGMPGNKSGATVTPNGTITGQEPSNSLTREQDTAGVRGMRGNKSGPAATPPSSGSSDNNSDNSSSPSR